MSIPRPRTYVLAFSTYVCDALSMNVHVTFSVDPAVLAKFDAWVKSEGWKTRSEAIAWLMKNVKHGKEGS